MTDLLDEGASVPDRHSRFVRPARRFVLACALVGLTALADPGRGRAADFSDWTCRMAVTFDGYDAATSLTNFPVLVKFNEGIADFYYTHFASDTGGDLRFSAADGTTELNYEIDEWHTDGTSLVWVSVPVLTNGASIYAYWGNAGQTAAPAYTTDGSTWTNGFRAVWHMKEIGNAPADSAVAVSDNSGTSGSLGSFQLTDGKVGTGYDYVDNGRVDISNAANIQNLAQATVMFWYYKRGQGGDDFGTLFGRTDNNGGFRHHSATTTDFDMRFDGAWVAGTGPLPDGAWYHIAATYDNSSKNVEIFLNGTSVDTGNAGAASWCNPIHLIGSGNRTDRAIDGIADEMRCSDVVRSVDWIRANFLTTASNDVVTTYDTLEIPPVIENLRPVRTSTTAELRADLVTTGGVETTVWVAFGPADGGTDAGAWSTNIAFGTAAAGLLSTTVTGLTENAIYYYRFAASNSQGLVWAPATTRLRTPTDFSAWGSRLPIAFTNCINTAPLELFPVLVRLNESIPGFSYRQFASPTGADLRFADADGKTELDYEIDTWDTGGTSLVWVQLTALTNDTQIWAFWGNAAAATGETGRTWSDGFVGVYHLGAHTDDSTTNGNNGVAENGPTSCAGVVGAGLDFSPGQRVDLGDTDSLDEIDNAHHHTFTLGAWVNLDSLASDRTIIGRFGNQFVLWYDKDSMQNYVFFDNHSQRTPEGSGIAALQDTWQYVTATGDGSVLRVYVNGVFSGASGSGYNIVPSSDRVAIADDEGDKLTGKKMDGSLDEARIAYACRSEEWIRTEYLNMASNDWFNTSGEVESAPFITTRSPTNVLALSATVRGELVSTGTAETVAWVYYGPTDGGTNPAAWDASRSFGAIAEGVLSTNLSGLEHESTYYYRFYASNAVGAAWASTSDSFTTSTDFTRWVQRMPIAFTNYTGTVPLTNFPALVKFSAAIPGFSHLRFASGLGNDLRFSAADQTTPLDYEIETWDPDGESCVWVKIPAFTNNTTIWAFWGSAADAASPSPREGSAAWCGEYLGVYHLNGGGADSTTNANDGVEESGPVDCSGVVGGGLDFAGGARVDLGGARWNLIDRDHYNTFTMGAWVNPDVINADQAIFGRFSGVGQQFLFWLDEGSGLANYVFYDTGANTRTPENTGIGAVRNQWQYVVATSDGAHLHTYVNGVLSGSSPGAPNLSVASLPISLGTENGNAGGRPLDGSLDEARIAYACRPLDWIRAEYLNMASNDSFNTYDDVVYNAPAPPLVSNVSATGMTYQSAWLLGELVSTGTAETAVWVYYGTADGGEIAGAWAHSAALGVQSPEGITVSTELTGLDANTDYFYRFYASNAVGGAWAPASSQFGTALRLGDWARWARINLRYDGTEPLTNFPMLVTMGSHIGGFSYGDVCTADGTDLRFTADDGRSFLDYEIEEWNTGGVSYAWVKIPALTSDTVIHALWGNPGAPVQASVTNGAVWDDKFRAVWHLDQTAGAVEDLTDATTNACDGVNHGSVNIDGLISKGQDFSNDYIDLVASSRFLPAANSPITLSCWVHPDTITASDTGNRMFNLRRASNSSAVAFGLGQSQRVNVFNNPSAVVLASTGTILTDEWTHITLAYDGATYRIYVNGAFDNSQVGGLSAGSADIAKIGTYTGSGDYFDGIIDELRVEKVARSAEWIRACWLTQASNGQIVAFGPVEDNFDYDLPTIETLAATDILAESATLNGNLTSTGASTTAVSLYWGETDGGNDTGAWDHEVPLSADAAPGAFSHALTTLDEGTTYYYRFYASNDAGTRWGGATRTFTTYLLPDVDNAGGATAGVRSAVLNGSLVADNGAACGALVYWGPADGGAAPGAWANTNLVGAVAVGPFSADTRSGTDVVWDDLRGIDIGSPGSPGGEGYTGGVWTVSGSGANFWSGSDQGHFAYRLISGDFDVYVRMSDYTAGTETYRKGGLMVRESLAANSRNAFTMRTPTAPTPQLRFQRRTATGGETYTTTLSDRADPYYWLRLTRVGNTFTSYYATDTGGTPGAWTQIGATGMTVPSTLYIGLAICSYSGTELATADFDGWSGPPDGNLLYGLPYYYRCSATNAHGQGWAATTDTFFVDPPLGLEVINGDAGNITHTSATLNATLMATGAVFDVYACWGETDAGSDLGSWEHAAYAGSYTNDTDIPVSCVATGLTFDTPYFFTFYATNPVVGLWPASSATFRTVGAPSVTNAAPLDYTAGSATLRGVLTYGINAAATVYWGLTDEGMNAAAWDHATAVGQVEMGVFGTTVTVGAGGTYYYRCYVSNAIADAWAPATTNFTTPGATISIANANVIEGNSGTTNLLFTVTPSLPCASNVTVRYQTTDGSALAGLDYTAVDNYLAIPAMQSSATIAVPVLGDTEVEWPEEAFTIDLSAATNATIDVSHAIGTILDDDIDVREWQYKMRITLSGYDGTETLRNFPVLVKFDPTIARFAYSQFASAGGYDLRFLDATESSPLSYEIEHWDTNGTSLVWVRVPRLSGRNTSIWAYWGCTNGLLTVDAATDIPDCVLWLRADAGVQTSGSEVTGWLDQSGRNNHTAQSTPAKRPTLVNDVVNGKPVVRFGVSGQSLVASDADELDGTAGLTVFALVIPNTLDTTPRGIVSKRLDSSHEQSYSMFFWSNAKLNVDVDTGNNRFTSSGAFATGNAYITELLYDGTQATGSRCELTTNGAHDRYASETSTSIPNYASSLCIGTLDTTYSSSLGGDIAEVIIYRRALTADERLGVGRYLERKYALHSAYGDDASMFASDGSTWSEGYGGVWHLTEGGARVRYDSTTNNNDSVALSVTPPLAVDGCIAGGNYFNGNALIRVADSTSLGDACIDDMSVSIWLKSDVDLAVAANTYRALEKGNDYFLLQGNGDPDGQGTGGMNFFAKTPTSNNEPAAIGVPLASNQWYYVTGTFDGTDMRAYLDGVLKDTRYVGENLRDDNEPLWIGSDDSGKSFVGVLDELRISTVARSSDWVRAEYLNMASNATFNARGGVEVRHQPSLFIMR